jgi:hypothetical protein
MRLYSSREEFLARSDHEPVLILQRLALEHQPRDVMLVAGSTAYERVSKIFSTISLSANADQQLQPHA